MTPNQMVEIHLYSYLHVNKLLPSKFSLLINQLSAGQDLQSRKNMEGHVTSSVMLLDPMMENVLMVHHRLFDRWIAPGGHYEGEVSPLRSALRELQEESGFPADQVDLTLFPTIPFDIDTHPIPERPKKGEGPHFHHDFLYLGVAKELIPLSPQVEEVSGAEWISLKCLADSQDERNARCARKAIKWISGRL